MVSIQETLGIRKTDSIEAMMDINYYEPKAKVKKPIRSNKNGSSKESEYLVQDFDFNYLTSELIEGIDQKYTLD